MKKYIISTLSVLSLFLASSSLFASPAQSGTNVHKLSKDPVSWSIFPASGLPAQTKIGSSYVVTYTLTNNIPLPVPLSISGLYNGGKFSIITTCNTTLQPNQSCQVSLGFQPIRAGVHNATVVMNYHRNRVPLPQLVSTTADIITNANVTGHITIPLPSVTYLGVTYPMTFTFINNSQTPVATSSVIASGFTPTSNGCAGSIPAFSSCDVSGSFTPTAVGQYTFGVTYNYATGSVPLTTETNSQKSVGPCHQLISEVALPLPTSTLIYSDNVVKFSFTNACPTIETLGAVSVSSDITTSPPILTQGTAAQNLDDCSNNRLAPGASCSVYVSVIPNAVTSPTNDLSVTASVFYNGGQSRSDATSSEVVNATPTTQHAIEFVNQCSQPVWYGFQPVGTPDPTSNPKWSSYQMNQQIKGAAPATRILTTSQYYGGSIFGRTGCDPSTGVCHTANCTALNNTTGTCTQAARPPYTTFEENLYSSPGIDGFIDISLINGFNVPGEFRTLAAYEPVTSPYATTTFGCGNSGGAIIQPVGSALNYCTWSFSPPNTGTDCSAGTETDNPSNYYFVPEGADDGCTPGSCSGNNVCGMAYTAQPSYNPVYLGTPITRHCGPVQGYWTVADYTGYSASAQWGSCNLYSHYAMGATLDSIKPSTQPSYGYSGSFPNQDPMPPAKLLDMYGCVPTSALTCYTSPGTPYKCFNTPPNPIYSLNSGYDSGFVNVCGCHDWNNASTTPARAYTASAGECASGNSLWDSKVYSRILWIKEACPTAYSYQFDDKSSQYVCNKKGQFTSYQIGFCPGGKSGLPS